MKKIIWLLLILVVAGCSNNITAQEEPDFDFEVLSTNMITNIDAEKQQWISFGFTIISGSKYSVSELSVTVNVYKNDDMIGIGQNILYAKIYPGDIVKIEVALFNIPSHVDYDSWEYKIRYKE